MDRIVFLDRDTIAPDVRIRTPDFPHEWIEHDRTDPGQVIERLRGATVAITNKVRLDADTLAQLPTLRFVAVAATGTDIIDLAACAARGIVASNIQGYAGDTVPEHCFALILALRRSLVGYRRSVEAGRWQQSGQFCYFDYPIMNLRGQTMGIVGHGALGEGVAALARAFGMTVIFAGRKGDRTCADGHTPFDEVLATSDVLSLHCPLVPETRHLLADREFALMARRPIVINTARGGLIDDDALVRALRAERIAGAGIDVCAAEPPAPDHPFMGLLDLPNFVLTPHIGWAGIQAIQRLADQLIDNLEAFVRGNPVNVVLPR